jgi:hypothetical protein
MFRLIFTSCKTLIKVDFPRYSAGNFSLWLCIPILFSAITSQSSAITSNEEIEIEIEIEIGLLSIFFTLICLGQG